MDIKSKEAVLIRQLQVSMDTRVKELLHELLELREMRHAVALLETDDRRLAGRGLECRDIRRVLLTRALPDVDSDHEVNYV